MGVMVILPLLLVNPPVLPLPPSTVEPPDGDMTAIALPDVPLPIMPLLKSIVVPLIFNVLLAAPVLNNPVVVPSPPINVS